MAGPAEGRPEAVIAPASPSAPSGPRLQDAAVVTGTLQMLHKRQHIVETETQELQVTPDFFPQSGKACGQALGTSTVEAT